MNTFYLVFESFRFAWKALISNPLRSVLSLIGVTIGVFLIISIFTLVDSIKKNIKDSLSFLGSDVIYIEKWPFTPDNTGEYKWWEYWQRPNASYQEYKFLRSNLKRQNEIAILVNRYNQVVKHASNTISQVNLIGVSHGYDRIFEINMTQGRYFSDQEIYVGKNVVVVGHSVSAALFPNENPVNKTIRIKNRKYIVIGVIKEEGRTFLGSPSNDYATIIPYDNFRKLYQTGTGHWSELSSRIVVKGDHADADQMEIENILRGLMRNRRGLKPVDKDNFVLNRPDAISAVLDKAFDVVEIAGWIIGSFSILVGGFGITNIMLVSVTERTSIIGLQKSLGARNSFILYQFFLEAIILSLFGGLTGLLAVYGGTFISFGSLVVTLTLKNIIVGIGISTTIGLLSGVIPAIVASKMDPVAALRAN